MKLYEECLPCLLRFAERTLRHAGVAEHRIPELAERIWSGVGEECTVTPAHYGTCIFKRVQAETKRADPYGEAKREQNRKGALLLPRLRDIVSRSESPMETALKVSAAGNVIDLGTGEGYDIDKELAGLSGVEFADDDTGRLAADLEKSRTLLFMADNCGEIYFDLAALEALARTGVSVRFAVKSGPVINDATSSDARDAGIEDVAEIVETGSDFLGAPWDRLSPELRRIAMEADVVIGKGHANAETMDDWQRGVYLLLKTKCDVVARSLGVPKGAFICKYTG